MTNTHDSPSPGKPPSSNPFAETFDEFNQQAPPQAASNPNPYETPQTTGHPSGVVTNAPPTREPLPHPHVGWGFLWTVGLMLSQIATGIVTVILIVFALIATGANPSAIEQQMPAWEPVLLPIGTFTIVVVATLIAVIVFRRDTVRLLGMRRCTPLQMLVAILFVFPHAVVAGEVGNWAMEFLPDWGLASFQTFSEQNMLLVLISAALFPGLGEEIFFRGFLSRGLVGNHGLIAGAIISSLFFALIHMLPVQVCVTFLAGLTLQYVFLTTRSLWTSIVFHTLNNSLAFLMMRYGSQLPITGVTVAMEDSVAHTPVLLLLVSLLNCGIFVAVLYYGRTKWIAADGKPWNPGYFSTAAPPPSTGAKAHTEMPPLLLLIGAALAYLLFIVVVLYSAGMLI